MARSSSLTSHTLRLSIFRGGGMRPSLTSSSNFEAEIPAYSAADLRQIAFGERFGWRATARFAANFPDSVSILVLQLVSDNAFSVTV